jgi:4-hydroxybenzoate polyprenyltransferase
MPTTSVAGGPTAEMKPARGLRAALLLARDIKLAHSIFALPFALLAFFLAKPAGMGARRLGATLGLVVVCMVSARTWAMLVNRLADARIDAANPRTSRRALASGAVDRGTGILAAVVSAGVFVLACGGFWLVAQNPWPCFLSAPVLAWIALYSFTKRFTALCHLVLGTALAASPLAAAIAVDPGSLSRAPSLWWTAGFVMLWVAGFDVIYAFQDKPVDESSGLNSIPAKLGIARAAWVSRFMHAGAVALLVVCWRAEPRLGWLFGVAVALVAGLLVWEHVIVAGLVRTYRQHPAQPPPGLNMAFFTLNGVVSCVVGGVGIFDVLK